eukprot:gnl/MRDRNA2_/MRDRNA2_122557_c0_seq1.p1 gnl/MRDRNA2_/MRDRNA2_122557_c0~~gnl/MRDRNA2_/MRDRNA2_122557_c0_seq1.p1  ORF type:complete len:128 (+),score=1.61 gnl/MRDRNA2_/MRDRNA2_122557_c0_seq1:34-417(+)
MTAYYVKISLSTPPHFRNEQYPSKNSGNDHPSMIYMQPTRPASFIQTSCVAAEPSFPFNAFTMGERLSSCHLSAQFENCCSSHHARISSAFHSQKGQRLSQRLAEQFTVRSCMFDKSYTTTSKSTAP